MKTKVCSKCGEEKPVSEFHKAKDGKYGVQSMCKDCNKANSRKQYADNYYQKNRKHILEQNSEYRQTEQGKLAMKNAANRRRARKYGNTPEHLHVTNDEIEQMYIIETVCPYCGCMLTEENSTIDHIIPYAKGGKNIAENVVLCCAKCNNKKRAKDISVWLKQCEYIPYTPICINKEL